jgi:CBS domain-containing protein
MKVRDIMTAEVVTAEPETSVNLVAQLMDRGGLSGVPVVDGAGRVVGIVTEVDLIVRNQRLEPPAFFQLLDGRIPLETPGHYRKRLQHMLGTHARDVMTEKVVSVGPDEEVEALAELMVKKSVNPVPVVENGRLLGIVSRADLIRMMARDLSGED